MFWHGFSAKDKKVIKNNNARKEDYVKITKISENQNIKFAISAALKDTVKGDESIYRFVEM